MIIHLFGGIHEIYFPYVLARPIMLLAVIGGGMSGLAVGSLLGAGLVGPASPGSILAYFLVTPRGGYFPMLAAVLAATAASFVIAAALLGFHRPKEDDAPAVTATPVATDDAPAPVLGATTTAVATRSIAAADVDRIVIACDAGMGSSVMVAGAMKKRLAPSGVEVSHSPVNELSPDTRLVMCQSGLADRARAIAPNAVIVRFEQFLGDPAFTAVENAIKNGETIHE